MLHRLAAFAMLVIVIAPATALADARTEARTHMERAAALHAEGKFAEALTEITIAYSLEPKAERLYAIAQMHVQLGDCAQAITFYRRFLSTRPDDLPKQAAREAVATCKERLAAAEGSTGDPAALDGATVDGAPIDDATATATAPALEPAPSAAPAEAPAPRWYHDKLGLALVGGGVTLGILGLATYSSAVGDLDDAEHAASYAEYADLVDGAGTKRVYATVLTIAALAATGAGVYRLVQRRKETRQLVVAPTADGGMVSVWGSF